MSTQVYRFLSLSVWGNLPSYIQRSISSIYASIFNKSFTRYIIKPYCKYNYKDEKYLDQFRPACGAQDYRSFQDFFTRVYKQQPTLKGDYGWPCEGIICDYGEVKNLPAINVKGDLRNVKTIFGKAGSSIPDHYYFSNIFLHNNNYHRIHSPVSCTIKSIEHINGDLVLLRPWVYKQDPSLPAMRNERVNLVLEDNLSRNWYLSIVGGPAVGTIVLNENIHVGSHVKVLGEIGLFLLGSTCCLAAPHPTQTIKNTTVFIGDSY